MKHKHVFILSLVLCLCLPVLTYLHAEEIEIDRKPTAWDQSIFAGPEFPELFTESRISGYDWISGAITFDEKAAKITFAPFFHTENCPLSDTRFQLSQKDGITTFGVSITSNPLSPQSEKGIDIWKDIRENRHKYIGNEQEKLANNSRSYVKKEVELLDEINTLLHSIKAKKEEIKKETDSKKKLHLKQELLILTNQKDSTIIELENLYVPLFMLFRERLMLIRTPILSLSYNLSLFPLLAASPKDDDENGLNDNEHTISKHDIALAMDWRVSSNLVLAALLSYSWERPNAEEGSDFARYMGGGLTMGTVLWELNKSGYKKTEEYKKSLFKPVIVLGASLAAKFCVDNKSMCKDGIEKTIVLTPFMDFKIKEELQFRLGLTFTWLKGINGEDQTNLGFKSSMAFVLGKAK
jgi:hypothetical protein